MTNPNYTAICLLVDRSGSMFSIRDDAEGGIRTLVTEQQALPGECTLRLVQFDDKYEVVYPSTPIKDVPDYILNPRGATALNDAWGKAVTEFGEELAALPEDKRPDKVVFVVVTDGYENSSREWTQERVFDLVKRQTDEWNWTFLYLAAGQDAMAVGAGYGVTGRGQTMSYSGTSAGAQSAYVATNQTVSSIRAGNFTPLPEKDEEE